MRRPEFVRATSLTCLAVCSLTHRTAAIQPMRSANKCSHQGCKTAVRCTRLHRLRAAAIFYPNFYPNSERSGVEVLYILVAALNWAGGPRCVTSLPSWSCGFDSRRPLSTGVVSKSVGRCSAGLRLSDPAVRPVQRIAHPQIHRPQGSNIGARVWCARRCAKELTVARYGFPSSR